MVHDPRGYMPVSMQKLRWLMRVKWRIDLRLGQFGHSCQIILPQQVCGQIGLGYI